MMMMTTMTFIMMMVIKSYDHDTGDKEHVVLGNGYGSGGGDVNVVGYNSGGSGGDVDIWWLE